LAVFVDIELIRRGLLEFYDERAERAPDPGLQLLADVVGLVDGGPERVAVGRRGQRMPPIGHVQKGPLPGAGLVLAGIQPREVRDALCELFRQRCRRDPHPRPCSLGAPEFLVIIKASAV
jgi:hypothetical protein